MKTIEEKAKAYDEIIERAKTMLSAGEVMYGKENNASQLITDIIPELRESEDERIRKWLVAQMQKFHDEANREGCWEDFCMTEKAIFYLEKQKEQKPAWSEEDEILRVRTINRLETLNFHGISGKEIRESIDWLKSLRPQPHWKPSEEQIAALKWQVEHTVLVKWRKVDLESLLEQLEKLCQ